MKKYTTFVENKKGEQKKISVWLDDETARAIDEANDPEITQFYILDKHKEDLIQRKETRRHTSLDQLFEQGHYIEEQDSDLSQYGVKWKTFQKCVKLFLLLQKNNVQLLLLGTLTICLSIKLDEEWGLLKKLLQIVLKQQKKIKKYYGIGDRNKQ